MAAEYRTRTPDVLQRELADKHGHYTGKGEAPTATAARALVNEHNKVIYDAGGTTDPLEKVMADLVKERLSSTMPVARGLQRLVAGLKAGSSDTFSVLGDSTSNGADKWLYPMLQGIGEHCGDSLRIVELLNSNGTGQTWSELVLQAGNGAPYFENPVGGANNRGVVTNYSGTLSGTVDIRVLCSVSNWDRATAGGGNLVNYGDGSGAGAPLRISMFAGSTPFATLQVSIADDGGTDRVYNVANVCTESNLGAANALFWLRVVIVPNNGSGNSTCAVYVSKTSGPSEGMSWTQVGTTTTAATFSAWSTSATSLELLGRQTAGLLTAVRVYRYQLRIDGSGDTVAVVNPQVPHTWYYNYTATSQITPINHPTLWVINRSVSGGSLTNMLTQTGYFPFIFPNYGQSVFLGNFSFNDTTISVPTWETNLGSLNTEILNRFPTAGLVLFAQPPENPDVLFTAFEHRKRVMRAAQFGANKGAGFVAAYHAVMAEVAKGTPLSTYVSVDGRHPSAPGYALCSKAGLDACGILS